MTNSDKDFIVAIELGSSKISGIAGKKKDGTMQVLAYAEEKTAGCIKRGVVYNIEKTYQSINTIIQKLEAVLKTKITRAYIGLGGQSMRSYKCVIKRNLLTQSYITNELIDAIRQESCEIPFNDYEMLENFPQEYVVDSSVIADPVGVMGTNIEGEFLDVIAKNTLRANIETVFANVGVFSTGMFGGISGASNFDLEKEVPGMLTDTKTFNKQFDVFFISCGEQDPRIEYTRNIVKTMRDSGVEVKFNSYPGDHEWQVWRKSLHEFAQYLFKE